MYEKVGELEFAKIIELSHLSYHFVYKNTSSIVRLSEQHKKTK